MARGIWYERKCSIPVRRAELVLYALSHSQERLPEWERQEYAGQGKRLRTLNLPTIRDPLIFLYRVGV